MNFAESNEPTQEPSAADHETPSDDGDLGLDPTFVAGGKKPNTSTFVLIGLAVVAAGVIWFMYFRGGPQSAQAAATPGDGSADIKQFLDSGNINLMKQTLKNTEKVVQQFRTYPAQTQVPLASLHTNPFRELEPKNDGNQPKKNEDEELAAHTKALTAITELHLQSIVRGGKYHACMINNTLYSEGQQVGIFTVDKVDANTVILETGKYRFELKMQK